MVRFWGVLTGVSDAGGRVYPREVAGFAWGDIFRLLEATSIRCTLGNLLIWQGADETDSLTVCVDGSDDGRIIVVIVYATNTTS